MLKWKVGPLGKCTTVKPVGLFRSSLSTMTAVYLRLQVFTVSIFFWELGDNIGNYETLKICLGTQREVTTKNGNAPRWKTYFVAKEQISRTENLWLYRCEDRAM